MRAAVATMIVLALGAGVVPAQDGRPEGPTIAVVSFYNGAIPESWHWSCCGRGWTAGAGVAELVAVELERQLRGREMRVADRGTLHRLMIREDLERVDELPLPVALELAREVGAEYAVLGRVRSFEVIDLSVPFIERDDRAIARVTLDAAIFDTRSGAVVGEVRGLGRRAASVPPWDHGDAPGDIGSTRFKRTLLGGTMDEAVRSVAERIRGRVRVLTAPEAISPAG